MILLIYYYFYFMLAFVCHFMCHLIIGHDYLRLGDGYYLSLHVSFGGFPLLFNDKIHHVHIFAFFN
jgi:hypothetical protein